MTKKRFVKLTDEERKANKARYISEYVKTEKGKAMIARRNAKSAKRLSPVQILILNALKEGGHIRVWHQEIPPFGKHCELRSRDNRVLKSKIHMRTFELLQSEEKQGMLLEIKSTKEDETICVISKKGLEALEKG